jgi:hypothetical protein
LLGIFFVLLKANEPVFGIKIVNFKVTGARSNLPKAGVGYLLLHFRLFFLILVPQVNVPEKSKTTWKLAYIITLSFELDVNQAKI